MRVKYRLPGNKTQVYQGMYVMKDDFWNQQYLNGNYPTGNNGHQGDRRTSRLLHEYAEQPQQIPQQYSPPISPAPQGPPSFSPMPTVQEQSPQQQGWPVPTVQEQSPQQQRWPVPTVQEQSPQQQAWP